MCVFPAPVWFTVHLSTWTRFIVRFGASLSRSLASETNMNLQLLWPLCLPSDTSSWDNFLSQLPRLCRGATSLGKGTGFCTEQQSIASPVSPSSLHSPMVLCSCWSARNLGQVSTQILDLAPCEPLRLQTFSFHFQQPCCSELCHLMPQAGRAVSSLSPQLGFLGAAPGKKAKKSAALTCHDKIYFFQK